MRALHTELTISELREYLAVAQGKRPHSITVETYFTPLIKWMKERIDRYEFPFHGGFCIASFVLRCLPDDIRASHRSVNQAFKFLELPLLPPMHFRNIGKCRICLTAKFTRNGEPDDFRLQWSLREWRGIVESLLLKMPPPKPPRRKPQEPEPFPTEYLPPANGKRRTLEEKLLWFHSSDPVRKREKKERVKRRKRKEARQPKRLKFLVRKSDKQQDVVPIPLPEGYDLKADQKYWKLRLQIMRLQRRGKHIPEALSQELNVLETKRYKKGLRNVGDKVETQEDNDGE